MTDHPLKWVSPSPLWDDAAHLGAANPTEAMLRPAILRFASDSFMDEFLAHMDTNPSRLDELQAQPETWLAPLADTARSKRLPGYERALSRRLSARASLVGPAALPSPTTPASVAGPAALPSPSLALDPAKHPLKLYQAAHERYYLLTACLVCGIPGLPDHTIDVGAGERASFVIRRLRPRTEDASAASDPERCDEYAYVTNGKTAVWRKSALHAGISPESVVHGEELLPL